MKTYNEKVWMTENLKGKKDREGNNITFYYPNNDPENIGKFGLLYDYETACKVCLEGWVLPSASDWEMLLYNDMGNMAADYKDTNYWSGEINLNSTGFSARPTGYGNNGELDNHFKSKTLYWAKTQGTDHIWTFIFEKDSSRIRKAQQHATYAFSVRCIKK